MWLNHKTSTQISTKPPHILIIGEAPGASENQYGEPFFGRSGEILRTIFDHARTRFLATITNTVCCYPLHTPDTTLNEKDWYKTRKPEVSEQEHCLDHTKELLQNYKFKGVMLLGQVAEEYYKKYFKDNKLPVLALVHPSFIARLDYKLLPIKENAEKIRQWIQKISVKNS